MVLSQLAAVEVFDLISSLFVSSVPRIAACSIIIILLLWRIWQFSLRHIFYPQEPKEYPYWIPCECMYDIWIKKQTEKDRSRLGHLWSFFKNSESLLTAARKHFDQKDDTFSIMLAGRKVYVVTDPYLVGQVFNNTTNLSFKSFLHDIMFEFGTSERGIRSILEVHVGDTKKSVSQVAHDLQVRQTQGDELRILGQYTIKTFQELLYFDSNSRCDGLIDCSMNRSSRAIWLKSWTAHCFITAGQRAYFGDQLEKIDPTLPAALMEMDNLSWQIFYRYPKFCRPQLQKLCDRILAALRRYLTIPVEDRQSQAWFTSKLEEKYRLAGVNDEDIATQFLFLYWGINTNISKVGFWVVVHLLQHPGLVEQLRRETSSAFHADGSIDTEFIHRSCPVLNALWLEALRISAASTALRGINQDFVLGNKILRKGNQVLVSARQLHLREQDFGLDAHSFEHRRFLDKPGLERSPAFRPFGGGPTICPGRQLAKYMTTNFVALLLHKFDLALARPQSMPRYEEGKPSIGIMGGDGDLMVKLTPRGTI